MRSARSRCSASPMAARRAHSMVADDRSSSNCGRCGRRAAPRPALTRRRAALELPQERRGHLVRRHRAQMLRRLALEQALLRVGGRVRRCGGPVRRAEGPGARPHDLPGSSWRPFDDLTCSRERPTRRAACPILRRSLRAAAARTGPGFDVRFGKRGARHTGGT